MRGVALPLVLVLGCAPVTPRQLDAGRDAPASPDAAPGTDAPDAAMVPDVPGLTDDATALDVSIPNLLRCGEAAAVHVTLTNSGTSTWMPGEVALVALGGSDVLVPARIELRAEVAPGATATFDATGAAPATGGAYLSDWQLARGDTPFGPTIARPIAVNCPGVDSIDLGSVVLHTSPPGVASWPITAQITALDVAPTGGVGSGGIVPSHTKMEGADRWPDVTFLGSSGTIYFTLWLALNIGGTWHAAGAQQYWYEPGLRMCGIPSGWTSNLFYDVGRWGEMSGYPIAPGEIIGVLVASGDHRSRTDTDGSTILERSPLVLLPFPGDTAITYAF